MIVTLFEHADGEFLPSQIGFLKRNVLTLSPDSPWGGGGLFLALIHAPGQVTIIFWRWLLQALTGYFDRLLSGSLRQALEARTSQNPGWRQWNS